MKARVVPPPERRERRELVRSRQTGVTEPTAVAKRSAKLSERAHIKLGHVASEGVGLSGRVRRRAWAAGEHPPITLAEWAPGKLQSQKAELRRAWEGHWTPVPRWVLAAWLTRGEELEAALPRVATRSGEAVVACADPLVPAAVAVLESLPGGGQGSAQPIGAAIGVDLRRVPSANHLASWAGVGPGNPASAGKRQSGQPPKGNKAVGTILVDAAGAATPATGTFRPATDQRVGKRLPKQKAWGAIAHRWLVISYHLLRRRVP